MCDANGNVTGIIPPSKPIHELTYNSVDKQEFYIPPKLADISEPQTKYEYNLDKQLEYVHRPDGKTVELVYDPVKKHLNSIKLPNGDLTYTYDENTGQLESIADISGESLSYNYDGSLPLSEVWQGTINGKFSLSYNNDFKVKETKSRYNYNVGVRQAKTLAQFNKFNAGMAIATAGALGFQAGAYAYCYLSCY